MQLLQYDEQTTRTQELNIYVPTSGFDYFYLKFITLVSPFRDYGSAKDVKSLNSWFESLINRYFCLVFVLALGKNDKNEIKTQVIILYVC